MVQLKTLTGIASAVLVGGTGTWFYLYKETHRQFQNSPYYKEAVRLLFEHEIAKSHLGEPIQIGRSDLADTKRNYVDHQICRISIPVAGRKDVGTLAVRAVREGGPWQIAEMDLQLEKAGQTFRIFEAGNRETLGASFQSSAQTDARWLVED